MSENKERNNDSLITFFSNPIVGFIGTIASILGIFLAIYFFFESRESRELIYYVHPAKAEIVKSGTASKLSIKYDNQECRTDITAAQIAFWYSGKLPIRRNNILKPFIIQTERGLPILEVYLRKTSRDVTGISIDERNLKQGIVSLSWDILEYNDGGVIQIIYAGSTDAKITANGVIEGQSSIKQLNFSEKIKSPYEQYNSLRRTLRIEGSMFIIIAIPLLVLLFLMLLFRRIRLRRQIINPDEYKKTLRENIFLIIFFLFILCYGIYKVLKANIGVPFDF